jgi:hypothetical protein
MLTFFCPGEFCTMGACVSRSFIFWVLSPGDSVSVFHFLFVLGKSEQWVLVYKYEYLHQCLVGRPCTVNLGWGAAVISSGSTGRLMWTLEQCTSCRALEEPVKSLINRVKSYLSTATYFWLAR